MKMFKYGANGGRCASMEKNLMLLAREVKKLQADVMNAEKGERAANPYSGTYGNVGFLYPSADQSVGYGRGRVGGYPNAGFGYFS